MRRIRLRQSLRRLILPLAALGWLVSYAVSAHAGALVYSYTGNDIFQCQICGNNPPFADEGNVTVTAFFTNVPANGETTATSFVESTFAGTVSCTPNLNSGCGAADVTFNNGSVVQWDVGVLSPAFQGGTVKLGATVSDSVLSNIFTVCEPACSNYNNPGSWSGPVAAGSPTSGACLGDILGGKNRPVTSGLTLSGGNAEISATFTPSTGLAQAAIDCGVQGFDWVQTITPKNENLLVCANADCSQTQLLPPDATYNDPTSAFGGIYCNPLSPSYNSTEKDCRNSTPYYYPQTTGQLFTPFFDEPVAAFNQPSAANGSANFTTELVGIPIGGGNPVHFLNPITDAPLDIFTWYDDYTCTASKSICPGGILVSPIFVSDEIIDPLDGTGGITITSVDVSTVPEPSTIVILCTGIFLLFGLRFCRADYLQ